MRVTRNKEQGISQMETTLDSTKKKITAPFYEQKPTFLRVLTRFGRTAYF